MIGWRVGAMAAAAGRNVGSPPSHRQEARDRLKVPTPGDVVDNIYGAAFAELEAVRLFANNILPLMAASAACVPDGRGVQRKCPMLIVLFTAYSRPTQPLRHFLVMPSPRGAMKGIVCF